ncbi:hypothetical protein AALP_AAs60763U000100, partial [Arabis alpina]
TKDAIADAGKEKERSDSDFLTPPSRRKMMHYAYSTTSSDDADDIKAKQVNDALTIAFDALTKLSDKDDLEVPPLARNKNLAPSQKSPFIGHSGTVRIMARTVPSSAVYNPFEPVDQHREEKLIEYVNQDFIISGYKDDVVAESCRQYTKMIPMLLKAAAPPEKRKGMSEAAFQFYRKKSNVPQNIQSGDCGVYTVKFLECLALGHTMDGICDATVPAIRLKLAADILEEAPFIDLAIQVSDPNPRTNPDDKVPLQTDSG